ncbi:GILT-like protein 1 [Bombyx mori]|uniref:GILT-like protein 1 n=1 Tax=Bombyx mori TaxID=7091 RepID=A0A8R2AFX7_BOMMO|nr:GILT-like protein 1 [Bombyx mori]
MYIVYDNVSVLSTRMHRAVAMSVKVILCLVLACTYVEALQTVNGKIKISVGTTAGCSDTVNFISQQLKEAYDLYKEYLEIEYVPWGRTRFDNGQFTCQFGVNDCWANRLHRCALNMLRGNQDAQVRYMQCEYAPPFPSFIQGSYVCAREAGLDLVNLDHCVANVGDELDTRAQAAAAQPMAVINFVPSIVLNDEIDRNRHNEAFRRLPSLICFALLDDPNNDITSCQI